MFLSTCAYPLCCVLSCHLVSYIETLVLSSSDFALSFIYCTAVFGTVALYTHLYSMLLSLPPVCMLWLTHLCTSSAGALLLSVLFTVYHNLMAPETPPHPTQVIGWPYPVPLSCLRHVKVLVTTTSGKCQKMQQFGRKQRWGWRSVVSLCELRS